jgi:putative SOS response-associated peptidase YedK
MCSRFVLNHSSSLLQQWYSVVCVPDIEPRYNIAPGNAVQTLRATAEGHCMGPMRWGFIPAWAEDPVSAPMLHNARCETVAEKPMFRHALRTRRCLIPASGFYEWKAAPRQKFKRPFFLSLRDGNPLSFAGLWEVATTGHSQILETCTIVTSKANALVEAIHHRMPVLLDREDWAIWLDPAASINDLIPLMRPYPVNRMQAWEVTGAVDRTLLNDPGLTLPLAGDAVQPALL